MISWEIKKGLRFSPEPLILLWRRKTKYPGVTFILGTDPNGKKEKIYHIRTQRYAHLRDEALKAGAGQVDDIFKKQKQAKVVNLKP